MMNSKPPFLSTHSAQAICTPRSHHSFSRQNANQHQYNLPPLYHRIPTPQHPTSSRASRIQSRLFFPHTPRKPFAPHATCIPSPAKTLTYTSINAPPLHHRIPHPHSPTSHIKAAHPNSQSRPSFPLLATITSSPTQSPAPHLAPSPHVKGGRRSLPIVARLFAAAFFTFSPLQSSAADRAGRAARARRSSAPSPAHLPARVFRSGRPADQISQHNQRRAQHGKNKAAHEAQKRKRHARDDQRNPQPAGRIQLLLHRAALTAAAATPSSVHSDHLAKAYALSRAKRTRRASGSMARSLRA